MPRKRTFTRELRMLNRARKELGLPPMRQLPKAVPDRVDRCLIAASLGMRVAHTEQNHQQCIFSFASATKLRRLWRTGQAFEGGCWADTAALPPVLNKLANDFDAGLIPELIEGATS